MSKSNMGKWGGREGKVSVQCNPAGTQALSICSPWAGVSRFMESSTGSTDSSPRWAGCFMDQGLQAACIASAHVTVRTQLDSCPYLQGQLRNAVSLCAPDRGKWFGGQLANLPQYLMNGTCSLWLLCNSRVIHSHGPARPTWRDGQP